MNLDTFTSTLVEDIKKTIETDVRAHAKETLTNAINRTVYLEKKTYRPTFDLLNAVEILDLHIGRNKATFRIGIEASMLKPDNSRPWDWNAHSGVSGQPFQEGLVEVLDEGTKTVNKLYSHAGYGFFNKAYEDLEVSLIMEMANSLRAKGWDVEVY